MVVITSLLPEEGFLVSAPLFILIVFFNLIYLFLFYFWLCSVFVVAHGLSLVVMYRLLIAVASRRGAQTLGHSDAQI